MLKDLGVRWRQAKRAFFQLKNNIRENDHTPPQRSRNISEKNVSCLYGRYFRSSHGCE